MPSGWPLYDTWSPVMDKDGKRLGSWRPVMTEYPKKVWGASPTLSQVERFMRAFLSDGFDMSKSNWEMVADR